jgi:hypothetical protein
MTVKILLLKSGEDVITDLKEMISPDEKVIGYFLTKPCVVKLIPKDSEDESKRETAIRMYPWMPLAKEKDIPLPTDWVVTIVTPIEKVEQMYREDVLNANFTNREETLNGKTTNKTNSPSQSTEISISD